MPRPTLQDVAARAGVSTATVDRVLHAREGVSERSRERVQAAVHDLGFGRLEGVALPTGRGPLRFAFLLPEGESGFTRSLLDAIGRSPAALTDVEVLPDVRRLPMGGGRAVIDALDALDPAEVDGVALFSGDTPGVRQAIDAAIERGVAVVTLVTDIPGSRRRHYVGIDNFAAGRVAATLTGRFAGPRRGPVAMIAGGPRQRDQLERQLGFEGVIAERFGHLEVLPLLHGDTRPDTNRGIAVELLRSHPDLVGIYSLSAGNASLLQGLDDAARAAGRRASAARRPLLVAHELSPAVREALIDGRVDAVIAQDVDHIARSAVRVLRAHCLGLPIVGSQERIRIDVHFADNLP